MKTKFLLAGLAAALTLGALAPAARADHGYGSSGYYITRIVGYDRCGHPIYQRVWVPTCHPRPVYPPPSCGHGHSHGHASSGFYFSIPGFSIHFRGSGHGHGVRYSR